MKQISIQITDETARQMEKLARRWGLPPARHNTPVIERAIATIYIMEIGYDEYTQRMKQMMDEGNEENENNENNENNEGDEENQT